MSHTVSVVRRPRPPARVAYCYACGRFVSDLARHTVAVHRSRPVPS